MKNKYIGFTFLTYKVYDHVLNKYALKKKKKYWGIVKIVVKIMTNLKMEIFSIVYFYYSIY